MVKLVTFSRKGKRKEFEIGSAPSIIGRKPEADIRIPLGEVSRAHCEVRLKGNQLFVRDLGSSNGTYVNNERVTEAALKAGDTMRIGLVQFTVQIDGKPEKIVPLPGSTPAVSARSQPARADTVTKIAPPRAPSPADAPSDDDFDIDELEELDSEDLSDLDLGEVDEISDSGIIDEVEEVEEIEGLEEISEDDLIPDEDSDKL